jgi:hypothetical protein
MADVDTIASAAQKSNINPLLLFAITGAEVSFDSETLYPSKWVEMHDNPFNVSMPGCGGAYYDTCGEDNLQQTANEAAVTVATRLSSKVPPGENAIAWINDPNNPVGAGIYAGTNADPTTQWVTNTIGFFNGLNSTSGIYSASEQQ